MDVNTTGLILIGFQNDYFAEDGILRSVIDDSERATGTLRHTLAVLEALKDTPVTMISTPILFSPDYRELHEPVGILKAIRDAGAFRRDSKGGETLPELLALGDRILEVPGKRGLNAFSNTDLDHVLQRREITDVVLMGVATSICIDSTGRAAHERGYRVTVISDATSGRSHVEQDFYCSQIFPLYAQVISHRQLLTQLGQP